MRPYIGITGFTSAEEVKSALEIFEREKKSLPHLLMVGVLASIKTLHGQTNRHPNRYPKIENIFKIFINHPSALNLVHYASNSTDLLFEQLMAITELIGPDLFHGFQLNIPWPDKKELCFFKKRYPDKKIVLQISRRVIEDSENNALILRHEIGRNYYNLIDYILLDLSGGRGKLFDILNIKRYLLAMKHDSYFNNIEFGVAGGLSGETIETIKPLFAEFPDLCIDAEGRLRDKNDYLDMSAVKKYISGAIKLLT